MRATSLSIRRRLFLPSASHPLSPIRYHHLHRQLLAHPRGSRWLTSSNPHPPIPIPIHPRPVSTSPSSPAREPRKALSWWTVTFTLLVLGGGVWINDKYFNPGNGTPGRSDSPTSPLSPSSLDSSHPSSSSDTPDTMTTTTVTPPGTVGNLTPEQETKLRELWTLVFKVCGIQSQALEQQNSEAAPPSPTAEKKTRRKYTWFGKAYDEPVDDAASVTSNGAASSIANLTINDGDDKHGQSKEFQQALSDMKPEEIRTAFWNMVKHDHPDSLLLRFLRARKWDVKKALVMLISTIRWRMLDVKVDDDIMKNGEALARKQAESSDPAQKKAGEEFLAQLRMGKSFIHGVDKAGRPICVVRVRLHRSSDQSNQVLERFTVFTIESARLMLVAPVETATIIFDMTNFTLANMDYTPVKFMIKCFEANYPECLGTVLIHKAPWIFSGIWNIIKGWLDPVVASKIHFTRNKDELENFISHDRITKELEGGEDWEYKYPEVKEGENQAMEDTAKRDELLGQRQELAREMENVTLEWIATSSSDDRSNVDSIKEKRSNTIKELGKQYWTLDPYIRARSLYDRNNVIQPGGKIDQYPSSQTNGTNGDSKESQ